MDIIDSFVDKIQRLKKSDPPPKEPDSNVLIFSLKVFYYLAKILVGIAAISVLIKSFIISIFGCFEQHNILLYILGCFVMVTHAILAASVVDWIENMKCEHKKILSYANQILGSVIVITATAGKIADGDCGIMAEEGSCGSLAKLLAVCTCVCGLLTMMFPEQMNNTYEKRKQACVAFAVALNIVVTFFAFRNYYKRINSGKRDTNTTIDFILLTIFSFNGSLFILVFLIDWHCPFLPLRFLCTWWFLSTSK